jgi:hypothetical protein
MAPAATASLHRRIRFAASCRYGIDRALLAPGLWRSFWLSTLPYGTATVAFDLLEFLRTRGQADQLGRPHLAALAAPLRLPQDPRYLGYWYDADRHSLVGLHLGIDIHRHRGRYFVIECNAGAGNAAAAPPALR